MSQEMTILAAACCPRCDGQLVLHGVTNDSHETSVFLG